MDNQNIRKAGLKVTLPRTKILKVLENNKLRHVSAENIYKALLEKKEEIGLATIYRVLSQFETAGLVRRHNFTGEHAIFELNQGEHHDHIVCLQCGHVEEFVDETIEIAQYEIIKKSGFKLIEHSLILYGDCNRNNCPYLEKFK